MATEPATERQREGLQKWGVAPAAATNPALSKREASDWMDELSAVSKGARPDRANLHHVPPSGLPVPVTPPASMGAALAPNAPPMSPVEIWGFNAAQVGLIKEIVSPAVPLTDRQLHIFLYNARRLGLDPVARQIFAIVYKGKEGKPDTLSIQTSIDGYRAIAARTGQTDGIDAPVFGPEVDIDGGRYPEWASVTVYRKGASRGFTAVVRWKEVRRLNRDGSLGDFWIKMPYTMLGKCAEARAWRMAIPADLSGTYTEDEMDQANNPPPAPLPPEGGGTHSIPPGEKAGAIDVESASSPPVGEAAAPAPKPAAPRTLDTPDPVDLVNVVQEISAAANTSNPRINRLRHELVEGWCAKRALKDLNEAVNPEKGVALEDLEKLRSLIHDAGVTA